MKLRVRVEDQFFTVEVGDLHARPVLATVDGETFEVWPEAEVAVQPVAAAPAPARSAPAPTVGAPRRSRRAPAGEALPAEKAALAVFAPLPGAIDAVTVQPGDEVAVGQGLCIIEAMKMKNVIRAPRAGRIAEVRVSAGQHVKHNDLLVEYED